MDETGENMQIFEEVLFFKLCTTEKQTINLTCLFFFCFYVAWKRGFSWKFARFVLFHPIKKCSFNLLCVCDFFSEWCQSTLSQIFFLSTFAVRVVDGLRKRSKASLLPPPPTPFLSKLLTCAVVQLCLQYSFDKYAIAVFRRKTFVFIATAYFSLPLFFFCLEGMYCISYANLLFCC